MRAARAKYSVLIYPTTILKATKIILKITLVKGVVDIEPQDENIASTFFFCVAEGNCFSESLVPSIERYVVIHHIHYI